MKPKALNLLYWPGTKRGEDLLRVLENTDLTYAITATYMISVETATPAETLRDLQKIVDVAPYPGGKL